MRICCFDSSSLSPPDPELDKNSDEIENHGICNCVEVFLRAPPKAGLVNPYSLISKFHLGEVVECWSNELTSSSDMLVGKRIVALRFRIDRQAGFSYD